MELVLIIWDLLSPVPFKRMRGKSDTYDTVRQEKDIEDKVEDKQKATTAMEIARSGNYLSLALPKQNM